jgi:hypothetical protein
MNTVWKYQAPLVRVDLVIGMPRGAQVVEVAWQDDVMCIWAIVDDAAPIESRYFEVVGTGHQAPDGGKYVGTAHVPPFVWHLFEVAS